MSIKLSSILMTVVCLSVCLLFGAWTQQYELIISIVLVLAIGIPHGALDHELFRFLPQSFPNLHNQAIFFVAYIGLMFTYLGLWLVAPLAALIGFLGFTIYHFGQGDWENISFKSRATERATYLIWGSFVTLSPLLLQYQQAIPIISKLIGYAIPNPNQSTILGIVAGIGLSNLLLFIWLFKQKIISAIEVIQYSVSLLILAFWFSYAPLILGFSVYFCLWHSQASINFQIDFFRKNKLQTNWASFLFRSLPLTCLAIVFGLLIYNFLPSFKVLANEWVFIFVSLISLPHVVLMDYVLKEKHQPKTKQVRTSAKEEKFSSSPLWS